MSGLKENIYRCEECIASFNLPCELRFKASGDLDKPKNCPFDYDHLVKWRKMILVEEPK